MESNSSVATAPLSELSGKRQIMEARYRVPYNWLHAEYSIRWAHKTGMARIIMEWIPRGSRLLDVGCGDGWYVARFAERCVHVDGIDMSARAIGFASLIIPDGTFRTGPAEDLPYEAQTFDVVTCIQVLEHMPEEDGRRALAEFRRVLKPGGRMIISVPSVRRPLSKAHLRHYTPEDVRSLVGPFGKIVTLTGHESCHRFPVFLRKIFENRFWFLQNAARKFYGSLYFSRWSCVPPEEANNIIAVLETT